MKRFLEITIGLLLSLVAVASCAERDDGVIAPPKGATVSVTLLRRDFATVKMKSRAVDANHLRVIFYDNTSRFVGIKDITDAEMAQIKQDDGTYKLTFEVPGEASVIHFVYSPEDSSFMRDFDPSNQSIADYVDSEAPGASGLSWASASVGEITAAAEFRVELLRDFARVSVENKCESTGFVVEAYGVAGTASTGYLVSAAEGTPRVKADESYGFNLVGGSPDETSLVESGAVDVFESAKGHGRLLIKATYGGTAYYYSAAFTRTVPTASGAKEVQDLDILRNHHYIFRITSVSAPGWSTLEEAYAAEPDNRLGVDILDSTEEITNLVAGTDYAMGVSAEEITIEGSASGIEFLYVSNYQPSEKPRPLLSATNAGAPVGWIHTENATMEPVGDVGIKGEEDGYGYRVTIPVEANTDVANGRRGTVIVKTGGLELTINVEQKARNYAMERTVMVRIPKSGGGYYEIPDYFAWLNNADGNGCRGTLPRQNRGQVRTDGLLFVPIDNVYPGNIEYYITKGSQDKTIGNQSAPSTTAGLTIEEATISGQRYWKVYQKRYLNDLRVDQKLTIANYDGNIVFPIYLVGFFHEITPEMSGYQAPGHEVAPGWYYYELTKAWQDFYLLDRNLGATSNDYYNESSADFRGNREAAGAYWQAATARFATTDYSGDYLTRTDYTSDKTIIGNLKLGSRLRMPTMAEAQKMNWTADGTLGDALHFPLPSDFTSLVADKILYLPHGGYYEGNAKRSQGHAHFWTSTIYCGEEGFEPNQSTNPNNNFGFWYYCFNGEAIAGLSPALDPIRCTDATANDFSDAIKNIYMPIRLVCPY